MSDTEAVARLTSRLLELDLDAETFEILLAALTANEATTTAPPLARNSRPN